MSVGPKRQTSATVDGQWDTDGTCQSGDEERSATVDPSTEEFHFEEEVDENDAWDFPASRYDRVDIDVALKVAGVEGYGKPHERHGKTGGK